MAETRQRELTKQDTKMIQGLSVLAMIVLHLFNRDHSGMYVPLVFFQGTALSFYIAQLCDFCVFGFAFCSGYGHMVQFLRTDDTFYKKRLKGLLLVFVDFWIILCIFSVVSIAIGNGKQMPGSVLKFLAALIAIDNSFNGAWWYLYVYAIIVFLSPLLLKKLDCWHPLVVCTIGGLLYCSAYYFRFFSATENWFLIKYGPLGMTIAEYMIGAMCCRWRVLSTLYGIWEKIPELIRNLGTGILIVIMLYGHTKIIPSLFIAPCTGFAIIVIFHFWEKPAIIQNMFGYMGKHSTNIWLTHMFFFSTLFPRMVYIAHWPILIFGLLLAIVILVSELLQKVEIPIHNKVLSL